MSIKKPNPKANLVPRQPAASESASSMSPRKIPVSATFQSPTSARTKLTHRLDPDLHLRFKLATTAAGTTMDAVLEELIADWVRQNEH
ncbi:hypothetical protein GP2_031_00070 [Gordonia paraffinivorans NBRC 108238]|uniref:Uncharacterized protein n=1 Tax=Gordonia paraffinivorans NBRC 108238 TaxID=1223543 RepID=A0ABQ0INQ6_9ACTN|nr:MULTISPECIES: plasmid partition protein ParG [Gordonia]GAC85196.1 hypothetical protein GP2_031_00070 [Gordonia paraffinivorans NBRC 108238]